MTTNHLICYAVAFSLGLACIKICNIYLHPAQPTKPDGKPSVGVVEAQILTDSTRKAPSIDENASETNGQNIALLTDFRLLSFPPGQYEITYVMRSNPGFFRLTQLDLQVMESAYSSLIKHLTYLQSKKSKYIQTLEDSYLEISPLMASEVTNLRSSVILEMDSHMKLLSIGKRQLYEYLIDLFIQKYDKVTRVGVTIKNGEFFAEECIVVNQSREAAVIYSEKVPSLDLRTSTRFGALAKISTVDVK